jgi:coenzyme PQQ biosynthesis protein PqqD
VAVPTRPVLWKHARLTHDAVRDRPVLLYPEGVMFLNATGADILSHCDGRRTADDIAEVLGKKYHADVRADVIAYLGALAGRDLVRDAADDGGSPGALPDAT